MTETPLSVRNLCYSAGGREILRGVNFSVGRGHLLAVIGPNGAGKSSLLRCAGGLVRECSGDVVLFGKKLSSMSARDVARRVAWVHQGADDRLPYKVKEFASMSRFALRPLLGGENAQDEAAVAAALETAGVSGLAERRLSALSGGERQRALIAAALAQETEMLFLDEPTSFLDYKHQCETLRLVERLNKKEGKTIVMVTHDVNLALHGADELLALKNGTVMWHGAPADFVSRGLLSELFDTEFELFERKCGVPYAAPRGLVL